LKKNILLKELRGKFFAHDSSTSLLSNSSNFSPKKERDHTTIRQNEKIDASIDGILKLQESDKWTDYWFQTFDEEIIYFKSTFLSESKNNPFEPNQISFNTITSIVKHAKLENTFEIHAENKPIIMLKATSNEDLADWIVMLNHLKNEIVKKNVVIEDLWKQNYSARKFKQELVEIKKKFGFEKKWLTIKAGVLFFSKSRDSKIYDSRFPLYKTKLDITNNCLRLYFTSKSIVF